MYPKFTQTFVLDLLTAKSHLEWQVGAPVTWETGHPHRGTRWSPSLTAVNLGVTPRRSGFPKHEIHQDLKIYTFPITFPLVIFLFSTKSANLAVAYRIVWIPRSLIPGLKTDFKTKIPKQNFVFLYKQSQTQNNFLSAVISLKNPCGLLLHPACV